MTVIALLTLTVAACALIALIHIAGSLLELVAWTRSNHTTLLKIQWSVGTHSEDSDPPDTFVPPSGWGSSTIWPAPRGERIYVPESDLPDFGYDELPGRTRDD